jgi:hypothetical protein
MVNTAGFGPDELARMDFPIVDHQLAVKQVQLFGVGMSMRRIFRSGC